MLCIVCLSTHCGLNGMTATDDQLITWRLRQQLICTHTRAHCAYTAKSYLHKEQTTPVLTKYRMHNNLAFYLSRFRKFSPKHVVPGRESFKFPVPSKASMSVFVCVCVCVCVGGGGSFRCFSAMQFRQNATTYHLITDRIVPEGHNRRMSEVEFFCTRHLHG